MTYLTDKRDDYYASLRAFSWNADYIIDPWQVDGEYYELPGFEEADHDGGGIYFLWSFDDEEKPIYVGHAIKLRARWRQHYKDGNLEDIDDINYAFGQDMYDMEVDFIRAIKPTRNRKRHR